MKLVRVALRSASDLDGREGAKVLRLALARLIVGAQADGNLSAIEPTVKCVSSSLEF